jgi:hypothetical protein
MELQMSRYGKKLRTRLVDLAHLCAAAIGILAFVAVMMSHAAFSAAPPQKTFSSPEEAVRARMVAHPAQYGSSGVMTFVVNHDGVVYEKDLGAKTPRAATSMS